MDEETSKQAIHQKIDGKKLIEIDEQGKLFNLLIDELGIVPDRERLEKTDNNEIRLLQLLRFLIRSSGRRKLVNQRLFAWGSNNLGQLALPTGAGGGQLIPTPKEIELPPLVTEDIWQASWQVRRHFEESADEITQILCTSKHSFFMT